MLFTVLNLNAMYSRIPHSTFYIPLLILCSTISSLYAQRQPIDTTDAFFEAPPVFSEICYPVSKVNEIHVLNFETTSLVYFTVENPSSAVLEGNIRVEELGGEGFQWLPVVHQNGFWLLSLEPEKTYNLLELNTCGVLQAIAKFSTKRLLAGDMIAVSEPLWEVLRPWKLGEIDLNLFDYLDLHTEIPTVERLAFLQNMVNFGEPISDLTLASPDILKSVGQYLRDSKDDGDDNEGEDGRGCFCRVMRITMTSAVTPNASGQTDPIIHPKVLGPKKLKETSKIFIDRGGLLEGPSKYKFLYGGTKSGGACENSLVSGNWGEEGEDETPSESVLRTATGRARIRITQMCLTTNANTGNCYCPKLLRFNYNYTSEGFADTKLMAGICGSLDGKQSQALVDDIGLFVVFKENLDFTDEGNEGEREILYTNAVGNLIGSTCERDFQEERIIDLLRFGYAIYGYIKGPSWFDLPDDIPGSDWLDVVEGLGDYLYADYQSSKIFKSLEPLLTNEWVVGDCDVSSEHATMGSIGPPVWIDDYEEIVFELFESSSLIIKGKTRWRARAEVFSGFNLATALFEVGSDDTEDDCCTRPAGIFAYSTQTEYAPGETHIEEIGELFSAPLGAYFPIAEGVSGQVLVENLVERGVLIPPPVPELNCETEINGGSLSGNNLSELNALDKSQVYFDGENLLFGAVEPLEGLFEAQLWSGDGRLLRRGMVAHREGEMIFRAVRNAFAPGIYFIRFSNSEHVISTKKVFLP